MFKYSKHKPYLEKTPMLKFLYIALSVSCAFAACISFFFVGQAGLQSDMQTWEYAVPTAICIFGAICFCIAALLKHRDEIVTELQALHEQVENISNKIPIADVIISEAKKRAEDGYEEPLVLTQK